MSDIFPSDRWMEESLPKLVERFSAGSIAPKDPFARPGGRAMPGHKSVVETLELLVDLLFPGCHSREPVPSEQFEASLRDRIARAAAALHDMVERTMAYTCANPTCRHAGDCAAFARRTVTAFFDELADARDIFAEDIQAAYEGDPAAHSTLEVALSYPGVYAVAVHRVAHILVRLGVPLIPRVMSEHAHSLTGIDIHPAAQIGPGFFIDHGTGVVIGETCVIGRHVKLYQGVTLGALSFAKDAEGHLVKGIKRHPDVEDNVVIYAGATILGGETRIGHDSVIGGNVWLIHGVPPYSKVYNQQPAPLVKTAPAQP